MLGRGIWGRRVLALVPDGEVLVGDVPKSRLPVMEFAMQILDVAIDILFAPVKLPIESALSI